jgi:endonuclease YncB( thermonuclease family)
MQSIPRALFISAFFYVGLVCSSAVSAVSCPPSSIQQTVQVASVHDGDTIKLTDGRKIRLLGINAPEVASNRRPAQPYAYRARDALRKLLQQADFKVGLSFGAERRDKYKRTLAHLYLADGTNIQTRLILQGYATAFTVPPNDRLADCYQRSEAQAIKAKQGIWSLPEYQVKAASRLLTSERGFRRVQGRVLRTKQGRKAFWIHMQGNLRVRIPASNLYNFDLHSLRQLSGKTIRVRGWIHPKSKGHFMQLRHPTALMAPIK